MKAIKTVIPFKPDNPKSRLSSVLTEEERKIFVGLSLENVLNALKEAGIEQIDILSKSELSKTAESRLAAFSNSSCKIQIMYDERDLNTAINSYLKISDRPVLIVMADLAMLTSEDIKAMIHPSDRQNESKIIRIAPGKDGGTNMMFIEAPDVFEVNYYGESFEKHKAEAEAKQLVCGVYHSFCAASDIDEPADLNDILDYGTGKIKKFVSETYGWNE